jgi:hypothetical protein
MTDKRAQRRKTIITASLFGLLALAFFILTILRHA